MIHFILIVLAMIMLYTLYNIEFKYHFRQKKVPFFIKVYTLFASAFIILEIPIATMSLLKYFQLSNSIIAYGALITFFIAIIIVVNISKSAGKEAERFYEEI